MSSYVGPVPLFLKRYIDDYFGIATCSKDELSLLIQHFDTFHPSLSFTHTISDTAVAFLDIDITTSGGSLDTSVHYKPTDAHSYLNYESSHPPACKKAIPFSQLTRLRRLCSNQDDFEKRCEEMRNFFLNRSYPPHVIEQSMRKIAGMNRKDTLSLNTAKKRSNRTPLIFTFDHTTAELSSSIRRNFKSLQDNPTTSSIFKEPPLRAFRKDRSLRDMLVHTRFSGQSIQPIEKGSTPCKRPRCKTCRCIHNTQVIVGHKGNYRVRGSFSCTTDNLVYAISCSVCKKYYIGETKRRLADRVTEHLRSIHLNTPGLPVARHFNQPGHSTDDFKVCGVLKCRGSDAVRKQQEERIIFELGTLHPFGLNATFRSFQIS